MATGGLYANSFKHLRGGMQIFVKTLPPHQLSSQPAWRCMPRQLGRASKQGEAATDGMSLVTILDKARGHVGGALKAFVPRCQG